MLMLFFTSILAATAQEKGLLGIAGTLCATGLGFAKWFDGRLRDTDIRLRAVETDTATNTATIQQIDKNVTWLRTQRENGHARDQTDSTAP